MDVAFAFANGDRTVTLTPVQPLAPGADTCGRRSTPACVIRLATASSLMTANVFTTRQSDVTPPKVSSIAPAHNAVDVPVGSFIQVIFTEAVDPATLSGTSVRVSHDGTTLNGTLALQNGNREVRFTPAQPLPFGAIIVTELTSAITDVNGNALVDANGNPLQVPLTFTFLTASFGITKPARGEDVVENRRLTLEVQASASLQLATVTFEVNGQALPAVSGPPFTSAFDVPAASTVPVLTVVAIGRSANGVEVARDEVTVDVVSGLQMQPTLFGIPLGGVASLRVGLSTPIGLDLPITLTVGDSAVVTLPATPVVLPAGQTEVSVPVGGASAGSTTIMATSARGDSAVVASVSVPIAKTVTIPSAAAGIHVAAAPLAGRLIAAAGSQRTVTLQLLSAPAPGATSVLVTSSNPAVARVDAPVIIAAGDQVASVTIITGVDGTATLTFRAGGEVWQLTTVVGTPPAGVLGPIFAPSVGAFVMPVRSAGRVVAAQARHVPVTIVLLDAPSAAATPVTVSSSNPAVASVSGPITVAAGQQSITVEVVTGVEGTATLTFRAGDSVRQLTIVVGAPAAGTVPLIVAPPAGVRVLAPPVAGTLFSSRTVQRTIVVPLLAAPRAGDTVVTISSSDANVASVAGVVTIPAGQLAATFTVATGIDGVATLTLDIGGEQRQILVIVGTPPAFMRPAILAPAVGVDVKKP